MVPDRAPTGPIGHSEELPVAVHMDLLRDLNEQQIEAVTYVHGPLLVLAGAGSGKTRVITRRVAYLIERGIAPQNIVAITFTNKAAGEMQERVAKLVPAGGVWISTFHKFCARLLRIHAKLVGLDPRYVIYDTADRLKVIRDCVTRLGLDSKNWQPERIEPEISRAKNELLDPVAYSERAIDYFQADVAKVYRAYQEQLLQSNAVDFDDLLLHTATLLRDHGDVRAGLDDRFRFILIDEYQDTNLAQYAILRCLCVDHPNLCATGDPDQSIYGWRGANIENILRFERDYPGAHVVRLERNYRSTKNILAAASHLIRFNQRRKPKELTTENEPGVPVDVQRYANEREEAQAIALRIREAVDSGQRRFGDFAIFFRVAALTRNFEMAFNIAQVPYQVLSGVAFYERAEVKDLLAYLKLLINPRDDVAFARVVNTPARGVGKGTLEKLAAEAARCGLPLLEMARSVRDIDSIKPRQGDAILGFVALIDQLATLRDLCIAEVIREVLQRTEYLRAIEHAAQRRARSGDSGDVHDPVATAADDRRANVEELLSAAHQFDLLHPGATVDLFLAESVLSTDLDDWDETRQAVSLMTLHAAKGLEFPVVFITAIEHGILPHARSSRESEGVEEERRLLFVGMTRARQELCLSHVVTREFRGKTQRAIPSRFLVELPARAAPAPPRPRAVEPRGLIMTAAEMAGESTAVAADPTELRIGMLVRHPTFGLGRIAELSGHGAQRKATIKFTLGGSRSFMLRYAQLQPVKR